MHPQFICALARERQAELLRQQKYRHHRVAKPVRAGPGRARQRVGLLLVAAGSRLLRREAAGADFLGMAGE